LLSAASYIECAAYPTAPASGNRQHAVEEFCGQSNTGENVMLRYALAFFVVAIFAAVFGFTGIAAGAAGIAKMLFAVFVVIAIAAFLISLSRRA
jgi:uncharacterized membrane protein YtjA (UPF0391 family)